MSVHDSVLQEALLKRESSGLVRSLSLVRGLEDLSSNDYLGVVRDGLLACAEVERLPSGSTGSRLLSGNFPLATEVEEFVASIFRADAALVFNSGYDANLGVLSSVPHRGDTVLFDELCHASTRDGIRLSFARAIKFRHNDLVDLREKIRRSSGSIYVAVESVYSMDGDCAPLVDLAGLCQEEGAALIVDEAHATGVFGPCGAGLCVDRGVQDQVFARIVTFGKAVGVHGAAVLGSQTLRSYLINFARSFIYSTALPPRAFADIRGALRLVAGADERREALRRIVSHYTAEARSLGLTALSESAIQIIPCPGNSNARALSARLRDDGFDARPILSPTVPQGQERLRVCLHTHNSPEAISRFLRSATVHLHPEVSRR